MLYKNVSFIKIVCCLLDAENRVKSSTVFWNVSWPTRSFWHIRRVAFPQMWHVWRHDTFNPPFPTSHVVTIMWTPLLGAWRHLWTTPRNLFYRSGGEP